MLNKVIEDRYGNELSVGSEVIFAEYNRSSNLYIGEIVAITDKRIRVHRAKDWRRFVDIDDVKEKLILNPYKK